MSPLSAMALSGIGLAQTRMQVAAHNIARLPVEGHRRLEVQASARPGGGVEATVEPAAQPGPALATDLVAMLGAKNDLLANLAVFRAGDRAAGTLLDTLA